MQQDIHEKVKNKQDDLWSYIPHDDIEIGQIQYFNDYELVQEEYLRNVGMMDNIEKPQASENSDNQDTQQIRQYNQTEGETKTDKMGKLRKKMEFLEKGMQS